MRRPFALLLAAASLASSARAQAPSQTIDVVVDDHDGHPVRGLKPEAFHLTDSGVQQTLVHVEEHSAQSPTQPAIALPPLPPGTFTDYTPLATGRPLDILLLDALNTAALNTAALNTAAKTHSFIRSQLQQYVQQANPNTRLAIFGLANRAILLQDFASDPATLRDVLARKLIVRSPAALASPGHTNASTQQSAMEIAANLRQFESSMGSMETQLRAQYTLDALNTLAHYLADLPGRKNLLWFSGSFPFNLLPIPSTAHSSDTPNIDQQELRETIHLLSRAQVAIYPIDAHALLPQPNSSKPDHTLPDALASSTGGRALYPTTTLASAVTQATDAGTTYYTLTYTPTTPQDDNSLHPLHLEINTGGAPSLQLFYPRGYYASAPASAPSVSPTEDERAAAYKHAIMSRGAPTPQDLIFKVRVLPASTTTETAAAPGNQLSPSVPYNGPFRRYDLDFAMLSAPLTLTTQPDGRRTGKLEFLAFVYDTEGRMLNAIGTEMSLGFTAADFPEIANGVLRCRLEVSVPDRVETFLRIGIREVSTNKFGVVEVPTSAVSYLPPAPRPPAPAGRTTPPEE